MSCRFPVFSRLASGLSRSGPRCASPGFFRPRLLATAVTLALGISGPVVAAPEQAAPVYEYALPASSLADVLNRFAVRSGLHLNVEPALLANKTSSGLQGEFSLQDGLTRLLQGTGLRARLRADGSLLIEAGEALPVLRTVEVIGTPLHPAQEQYQRNQQAFTAARSASVTSGQQLRDMSPANKGDALRYSVTGMINAPGNGDRFGHSTSIRTFGDWGAAESINGLPATQSTGSEGGGYSGTFIPSIAIDNIQVLKGGQGVGFGDGTDGGVVNYRIKSGRHFNDHRALSAELNTANETLLQVEAGDHNAVGDYYLAASGMRGEYAGEPKNLDRQLVNNLLGNFGWNVSDKVRAELLFSADSSHPDIFRNGARNSIRSDQQLVSLVVDTVLASQQNLRSGYLTEDSHMLWPARKRDRSTNNDLLFFDYSIGHNLSPTLRYDGQIGVEHKRTEYLRDNQWVNNFRDTSVKSRNSLTVADNLTLTAGLRAIHFDNDVVYQGKRQTDNLRNDSVQAYELASAYSLQGGTRLRASVASGYNRFFSKYGNFGTDALHPDGAGDTIVESRSEELGARHNLKQGYLDLAIWRITQDGVPRRARGGKLENMQVEQRGLEFEAGLQPLPALDLRAGYTHIFALDATRASGAEANGNIFWDGQTTSVPKNQFNLRADYRLTGNVGLWASGFHSTGYEAVAADDRVVKRSGFNRFDLGGLWTLSPRWSLFARVENLTGERDFGSTVKGVPVPDQGQLGRVYWIGVDVQLP